MSLPFSKTVENFFFGGPRFIPISSDGTVVYITDTDILAASANNQNGNLEIIRSTDGGSTWNVIAQTFNVNGNAWLFKYNSTVYMLQYNNLTTSMTPFEQWDGIQFVAVPSNAFPFAGTNNFVYNVRVIDNVVYIILVEFTQPGPQKNSRIYTWNGTTVTLFHSKNDMEYRDIAKIGTDIVIVGFSHDATGSFGITTVWDGMTFTDYPSSVLAGKRIVEHAGNHYMLIVPDQGVQPLPTQIAEIVATNPLSLIAGNVLQFSGTGIVGLDVFSDTTNLYVLSKGRGQEANDPAIYRYSLVTFQLDEQSFLFPENTLVSQQSPRAASTILVANWARTIFQRVFRLYEYNFAAPVPGANFSVTETKLIEVGIRCSDNSVYLNWLNRLGGRSFWLFDQETDNFENRFRTRAESEIRNEVLQLDEQKGNFKQVGQSEIRTLRVGTDGLSSNRLSAIIEMFSSPNILMLISEPGVSPPLWVQVAVRPGSFTFTERQKRLQFEIQLPGRFMQQN